MFDGITLVWPGCHPVQRKESTCVIEGKAAETG